MDDFEKIEMAKTRSIPENTWYQWSDVLINHFPESVKWSESDNKQKVIKFYGSKLDNDTSTDYKPKKKKKDAFESRYVEF